MSGDWEELRAGPRGLVLEIVTGDYLRVIGKWARVGEGSYTRLGG